MDQAGPAGSPLPGLVPHHAGPGAGRGALRHPRRLRSARRRPRRLRGDRAGSVAMGAGTLREPAERLHHRHQPRAPDQAARRSALAVRAGRLPRDRLEVRAAVPWPAPLEPEQLCHRPARAGGAGERRHPEPPMGQRPGHERGDLVFRAPHRDSSPHAPRHAHLCGGLRRARGAAPLDRRRPAARRNRADHRPDVPAVHFLHDHRPQDDREHGPGPDHRGRRRGRGGGRHPFGGGFSRGHAEPALSGAADPRPRDRRPGREPDRPGPHPQSH